MGNIADILDQEFAALVRAGHGEFTTLAAQAAFLEMSAPHLSRLRNGKAAVGYPLAQKLAERFRSTAEERKDFADALLEGKPIQRAVASSLLVTKVQEFLGRLDGDSLLCIDYRDFPRSTIGGKYPVLAGSLSDAIQRGACVAMFQPLGATSPKSSHEPILTRYLDEQRARVRDVLLTVEKQLERFTVVSGSAALYERTGSFESRLGTCLQTRFFYLERQLPAMAEYSLWTWVPTTEDDLFVQIDPQSIWPEAAAATFQPIVEHWRTARTLPDEDQMKAAAASIQERLKALGEPVSADGLESVWKPYRILAPKKQKED
jgi:hypothetical protein